MLYVDQIYIPQLSTRLRNFRRVKEDFNFSCPICNDSKKNQFAARGWFYKGDDGYFFKCYNCNAPASFYSVFKQLDEELFKRYLFDKRSSMNSSPIVYSETPKDNPVNSAKSAVNFLDDLIKVTSLSSSHIAYKTIIDRKIPKKSWEKIYFTDKFIEFTNKYKPGTFSDKAQTYYDHSRIVLPFISEDKVPFGFAGRALHNEKPKYLTIKIDEEKEKIFGLDTVDFSKRFYVTEGQIDSLFIDNAIASTGSAFNFKTIVKHKHNAVICYDNENRSKAIMDSLERTIDSGFNVFIWPNNIRQKDFNELVMSGYPAERLNKLIDDNTYSGLVAKLKYIEWRKI